MKPELRFEEREMMVAHLGEESCVPDLSGEVILQNELTFELGEEEEIYEGYGRVKNSYPYRLRNGYKREFTQKKVKVAVLENQNITAVFLPEYGGRLWELWDKKSGKNLLYTNDVLLFGNLAVRGAWFSGGVEWNTGVIGHTPFTTEQVYTAKIVDEQLGPVLRMYEYERIRGITYQMDFWLEEDSEFLNCRMRLTNEQEAVVPMYWWSNIAVPEFPGGRIQVPSDSAYTNRGLTVYKVEIPMVEGIDVTRYNDIPKSVDYFFDIPDTRPKYIANVDKDGFGLLQFSTSRLKSRKLFSWGHNPASMHWQEWLTKDAGPYVEIQAGIGKTQYGCIPMAPHATWEWMEQYGPVFAPVEELEEILVKEKMVEGLEEKLKKTKEMARTKAVLVDAGSGYGTLISRGKLTEHLEFVDETGTYAEWRKLLADGRFVEPSPKERPGAFVYTENSKQCLKEVVKGAEKDNWYAHYHYGVRCHIDGRYKKAKRAYKTSLALCKNAWAYHGLACVMRTLGKKKKASEYIQKGMHLQREECSYLKEAFKILLFSDAYEELCRFYETMSEKLQEEKRLKFYYIQALHQKGEDKKAYELLEADGGLVLDDIREGEDSLEALYAELYESLYHEKGEIPYRYRYKAY